MFTGIVETIGIVTDITSSDHCIHFVICPQLPFDDLAIGDSVSVNGVCLTVTNLTENSFSMMAVHETLNITNLNYLVKHSPVNLERSLKANGRFGGHYVQGHVDARTEIIDIEKEDSAWFTTIKLPAHLSKYVVNKGYITIDGMSITIVESDLEWFKVMFIPHTKEITIVNRYEVGSIVNIEVDIMSKYVEKILGAKS